MDRMFNFKFKENNFIIYLISLLPLSLLIGTFVAELVVFVIIMFFFYDLVITKKFSFLKNTFFAISILIYIYLIINLINSSNFELSLNRAVFFLRFPILAMSIAYFLKKNNFNFNLIYKCWMITIIVIIIDLYFQYIFGFNTLGFVTPGSGRLSGFLGDELKIAHLLIGFAMHAIIYTFINNKNAKIFYILILVYLIILFLTNERANAIKGTLIIFFSYLFMIEIKTKEKILFLIVLISLVSSLVTFNKTINQRFLAEIKGLYVDDKVWSIEQRERTGDKGSDWDKNKLINYIKYSKYGSHYLTGLEIFKQKPLLGSGIKTFREACYFTDIKKYYEKDSDLYKYRCTTHPHQVHIEWLSELGLIGYSLFIILFIYLFIKSSKIYFLHKNTNILCPIFFITCQYLPLLPSGSFFTNFGAIIFWINVGILYTEIIKHE